MKRVILSAVLLCSVFVTGYLALCFLIPGLRINLEAPPAEYFFASISHMFFFKALLSMLAALITAAIPWLIPRKSA